MKSVITGGTVSVEDCKKHDGYPDPQFAPTRKVRVELIFVVPEDSDEGQRYLDAVATQADGKVTEMLGKKTAARSATTSASAPAASAPAPAAGTPEPGSKAAREAELLAAGATPETLGRGTQALAPAAAGPKRTRTTKPPAPDAAAAPPATPAADPDELTPSTAAAPADDLDDLLGAPAKVEPVSDLELNTAIQKKNATLKSPPTIRKLVQTFNPDPAKFPQIVAAQIPQDKRHEFLQQLEALTV